MTATRVREGTSSTPVRPPRRKDARADPSAGLMDGESPSDTAGRAERYLEGDPFLRRLHDDIESAGHLRAITVDLTEVCNLRCQGCYFFVEHMDDSKSPREEADFDAFIAHERARGTNYVTVLGGEPSLMPDRLKKLHDNFRVAPATNGLKRIPMAGFETMPIAVSVWGDHETDTELRGRGRLPVFRRALDNYRDDPRVFWYYTVASGCADQVESVVSQIIENGNFIYFNYYEDNAHLGGALSDKGGFDEVRAEVDRMIELFPDRIISTSYLNQIATQNEMMGEEWGYNVCPTVTADAPLNADRIQNGNPYNPHFRAYNPDLVTTRRCCVGEARDCDQCRNAYAKHTWIMVNKQRHLSSVADYTRWLTAVYSFYLVVRAVDFAKGSKLLPEIHHRLRLLDEEAGSG